MKTLELDNSQSWIMRSNGSYERVACQEGERPFNSQMRLYDYFGRDAEETPAPAQEPVAAAPEAAPQPGWFRRLLNRLFGAS